ncbi:MAG: rhomboid family intramembrane serine protease [Planctomycetota bacterium]
MGIHDRHYVRDQPPPPSGFGGRMGGMRRARMWSATTWIIVVCVAVFVIDSFTPETWVEMSPEQDLNSQLLLSEVDSSALRLYPKKEDLQEIVDARGRPSGVAVQDIVANVQGVQIKVGTLRNQKMRLIERYMHCSTERGFLNVQFWRLIGFQFLHSHDTITHLLFNMIGLFVFGPIVEQRLGRKRFLAFYLLCGIFGALLYVALNLIGLTADTFGLGSVPGLLFYDLRTPLIGASAGVYGVIFGAAAVAPRATVLLFGIIPMTIRVLAWMVFAMAFLNLILSGSNAGGDAGHIGGALAGAYFIRNAHLLHDFFNFLGKVDPTSEHFAGRSGGGSGRTKSGKGDDARIDRILRKVSEHGLHSLTEKERKLLERNANRGE